jgi:hypothetical protein
LAQGGVGGDGDATARAGRGFSLTTPIGDDDFSLVQTRESAAEEIHANHHNRAQENQTDRARFHQET